jgi:pre-mRNA-splicing helicase BRR2
MGSRVVRQAPKDVDKERKKVSDRQDGSEKQLAKWKTEVTWPLLKRC